MLAPIQLFCERNGITLDWKGLKKYLSKGVPTKNQGAWTNEEIKKTLSERMIILKLLHKIVILC